MKMDQAGPVAISLKSLSNGVKTTVRQEQPSATMPVIADTGATLLIGHSAPIIPSAIACRASSYTKIANRSGQAKFLVPVTAERPSLAVNRNGAGFGEPENSGGERVNGGNGPS